MSVRTLPLQRRRSVHSSVQFLRAWRRYVSRGKRGGGWALHKIWNPASGAEIFLLRAPPARHESKPSASATGPPNSSTSRLQSRTTLAANRSSVKSLWWTRAAPFRKLQVARIAQASADTTSNLGSLSSQEPL